jgi:hypothetical protein
MPRQKVEGLTLLENGQLAVLNNNDFGVASDRQRHRRSCAPPIPTPEPDIGPDQRASVTMLRIAIGVNIRARPLFGMYLPDSIASHARRGRLTW